MSDYHEITLRRHEEELEQRYQEEYERAQNPKFYWFIVTDSWEDYAHDEASKEALIAEAKRHGLKYSCTKHVEGESYSNEVTEQSNRCGYDFVTEGALGDYPEE